MTAGRRHNAQLRKSSCNFSIRLLLCHRVLKWMTLALVDKSGECMQDIKTKKENKEKKLIYFSGTYIEERDAPIPGVPCLTGLLVMANSPR